MMFEWQLQSDDELPPLDGAGRWRIRQLFARHVGGVLLNNWVNVTPRKGRFGVKLHGQTASSDGPVEILVTSDRFVVPELPMVTLAKDARGGNFQLSTYSVDHGEVRRTDQELTDFQPVNLQESVEYWKNKAMEVAMGESSVAVRDDEVSHLARYIAAAKP